MADSTTMPVIDYTSRDFTSIKADLFRLIPAYLPEWTSRSETDFGVVLIELFSYVGDILGYYIDRAANEAYLTTAVQRASVLSLAQMIDYRPKGLAASEVTISFTVDPLYALPVTIPAGTQVATAATSGSTPIVFETTVDLSVASGATGTVTAVEGVTVNEDATNPVGVSDGSPGQVFRLYRTNVIEGSLSVFVDEDGTGPQSAQAYRFVDHLIDAGATDRAYTTFTDESGVVYVYFGDNANGRTPPQGAVITATYRVGVGAKGNVGSGTITTAISPLIGVSAISNTAAAVGGADAETIASIRNSAARSITTVARAVTADDYAKLAERVPGVLHAKATFSIYTNVILYVVPNGGGNPTTALVNAIGNYLADKKMDTATVTVTNPTYVPVNVTVNPLNVLPQYNRTLVQQNVQNAIQNVFDVNNVDFGERVSLSMLYRAIQSVEGVDYGVLTVLSTAPTGLADVVLTSAQVPSAGTISITATGGLIGT